MTVRAAMYTACEECIVAHQRECSGSARLTPEQLAGDLDDLLAEARIGCCQKCGCLEATAWIEGDHVVARCNDDPSARFLGHRDQPEPDHG